MKSAESWLEEVFSRGNWVVADTVTLRAIQRDALLEAAEIAECKAKGKALTPSECVMALEIRDAILERSREI